MTAFKYYGPSLAVLAGCALLGWFLGILLAQHTSPARGHFGESLERAAGPDSAASPLVRQWSGDAPESR
jgi:hypothetical protein